MIYTRNITPSLTEIYTDGGGYITEAYPTHFHTFATARPLAAGETVADFREVTAAEREAIEMADAAFVRPPQLFIDMWNDRCKYVDNSEGNIRTVGRYNETTGYFELNGLTDITYADAITIMNEQPKYEYCENISRRAYALSRSRTNLPTPLRSNWGMRFYEPLISSKMEVVFWPTVEVDTLRGNRCLKKITISQIRTSGTMGACQALEEIVFSPNKQTRMSLSFAAASRLSHVSVQRIIAAIPDGDTEVAITVHADVYDRITDETNEEWHALIAAAEAKNIVFATP